MDIISLFPSSAAQDPSGGGGSSYYRAFVTADWATGVSESTLSISASSHGLSGSAVDYEVFSEHYGSYVKDTWAAAQTYVSKESDGSIVLHAPSAFDGCVILTAYGADS